MSFLGSALGGLKGPAGTLGKYALGGLSASVGLGALPQLYDLSRFISGGRLPAFGAQQQAGGQGAAPEGGVPPQGQQAPPSQATFDAQSAQLIALLEKLAQQSAGLAEGEQAQRAALYDKLLDPGLYAERAAIDQAMWAQKQALAQQAGLEQTRELTKRKIESDTINAWRGITEAQIKSDALIAQGMMNIGYAAGVPNPSVLQAGASFAQQGAAGFTAPQSTLR